ncbi:MAG: DUF4426 domain-containing protein [Pseudomonadota bacterium]
MSMRRGLVFIIMLLAGSVQAESQRFGRFEVIYTVVNTTFVEPKVASLYQLVRARDRAFLNIAILETQEDGSTRGVPARFKGRSWDLFQNTFLEFKEVREGSAIYYIADFEFRDGEVRFFELALLPEGAERSETLRFHQKVYEEQR